MTQETRLIDTISKIIGGCECNACKVQNIINLIHEYECAEEPENEIPIVETLERIFYTPIDELNIMDVHYLVDTLGEITCYSGLIPEYRSTGFWLDDIGDISKLTKQELTKSVNMITIKIAEIMRNTDMVNYC